MNSLDPKITLTVYIVAAIVFVGFLTWMFVYNARLKTKRDTMAAKGRLPIDGEEGIAISTEKGKQF